MSSISSLSENFRHLLGFGPSTSKAPMPKCLAMAMKAIFAEANDE